MSSVKRKICLVVMIILVTGCLSACSQQSADVQSDKTETTEQTNYREGFSVREISDDLFDRMRAGKTYKEDCIVPREDLRYLPLIFGLYRIRTEYQNMDWEWQ